MSQAAIPYRFNPGPYTSHTLLLAALPADGAGRTVLDVGCSDGYLGEILARRGYRVTGIELPRPGRTGFPACVRLVEADLDAGIPACGGPFDYIICADVLEHLREPGARLAELRAQLAAGGRLVASLPNSGHAWFRWNILLGRFPQDDRGLFDRTHLHFYAWPGWVDLFARAGFAIESLRSSGVPVGLALPRWKETAVVRAMERLSFLSARLWKSMFAYQFVVTARPETSA
ncbi:MAG TPA: class I SAM-dependent methyltransferase [Bryobacteraceae bacterium]|nr:class I SAM-dependent methyltransferase [Bryobacteraceae bacterium]